MEFIYEVPTNRILALVFSFVTVYSAWRGTRLFAKGLSGAEYPSSSLSIVRGIRGWIIALAMGAFVGGVLADKAWLYIGAIFLGEELYETGVVLLALHASEKASDAVEDGAQYGTASG
jgi:hypothetical protein